MQTPQIIDPTGYSSLGELLQDAVLTYKSETALIEVDRKNENGRLSYLDFKREAEKVVRWLDKVGIGAGDRVAILMSNQSRWLIGAYAIFHRGAVLVPLDYKLSAKEQAALLAHCEPKALLTEHSLVRRFKAPITIDTPSILVSEIPADTTYRVDTVAWDSLESASDSPCPAPVGRSRTDLATIVYSSGTGGTAKGCMLSHDAYLEQLKSLMTLFPMAPGDRYFSVLPTNHAIDFMVGFIGPFSCGASVVHQRTLRPEFLQSTMKSYEITHMALVPLILEAFEETIRERLDSQPKWVRRLVSLLGGLNEVLTQKSPNAKLSRALLGPIHESFGGHLKLLFCGGAFVDRDRAEFFYRLGFPVVIGYGLSEVCTVATVNDLRPFRADSVGRPVSGVEIRIDQPGADRVGEVWIRGRTQMLGYLNEPELTAAAITEDGWLRTGDLGWLDAAHHLHLVGRSKNMIVTPGGKNIYPEDIESAFEGLPLEELVVFASGYLWPAGRDSKRGKLEDEFLLAVVRPKAATALSPMRLDTILDDLSAKNRRLPDFKRVKGVLLRDDAFPRTASMKIKRQSLAEEVRAQASEIHRL